jgi:glycosyltransferase involved in cell wall biosynthesis
MGEKNKQKHIILGFERRRSGAFEHAWGLAQNLSQRGFDANYYTKWWNTPARQVNLETEESFPLDTNEFQNENAIFYLQTHTWEHENLLEKIQNNPAAIMIYNLHAIIPYYALPREQKKQLLNGELDYSILENIIKYKMTDRERLQLSAMNRADCLLTISQAHKTILDRMIQKPTYVFENISDIESLNPEIIEEGKEKGKFLRESLEADNVLLYCGRVYEQKGAHSLFEAFDKIRENYPSTKMLIVGPGEERRENLFKYGLRRENLEDVILIPWINKTDRNSQTEVLKHYFASDALIQPMITEELYAKTVLDAMSLGIPAISCRSPYTIGRSEDSDAITESFNYIKQNPELVQKITDRARVKVARENTWESYIKRMNEIVTPQYV